jgi:RNA polymerase sigma-70 factor (ECF subfamily)
VRMKNDVDILANFLQNPNDASFTELFNSFTKRLVAFFQARGCRWDQAEDLAQEVMFKVYCKASRIRDRRAFRGWLFKVANNALCEFYRKQTPEIETITLEGIQVSTGNTSPGGHAFEFLHWMAFLDSREREVMRLRFLEHWEYHEIAAAQNIPIGTVQWRVFNAKKKLASHLAARPERLRKAA